MGNEKLLIENLIAAVSRNPILYDMTLPDYKNTHKKKSVWQSIAKEIKGKNGSAMCWKWKNLRDSYAKHRKSVISQGNDTGLAHRFINWRWAPYMTFLDPHLRKPRDIMASVDPEDSNNSLDAKYSAFVEMTQPSPEHLISRQPDNRKRKYMEPSDENGYEQVQHESASTERLDRIDYLFLNYAETFKKLRPRNQAMLKLQMAKIFAEVELQEIERGPIKFERSESQEDSE